jgi:hypothetical protein
VDFRQAGLAETATNISPSRPYLPLPPRNISYEVRP